MKRKIVCFCLFFIIILNPHFLFSAEDKDTKAFEIANYILGYQEGINFKKNNYLINFKSMEKGFDDKLQKKTNKTIYKAKTTIINQYLDIVTNVKSFKNKKTIISNFSYILGIDYTQEFLNKFFVLKKASFLKGIEDSYYGAISKHDIHENSESLEAFYENAKKTKSLLNNNIELFLANLKGAKKLFNGIKYQVLEEGTGSKISTPTVKVSYEIKSKEGVIYKSSLNSEGDLLKVDSFYPIIKRLIKTMKEGDHYVFYIPSKELPSNFSKTEQEQVIILDLFIHPSGNSASKAENENDSLKPSPVSKGQ